MSALSEIVYEKGDFWVRRAKPAHYEVYKNGAIHATRVATISSADDGAALKRAITECDRRAA